MSETDAPPEVHPRRLGVGKTEWPPQAVWQDSDGPNSYPPSGAMGRELNGRAVSRAETRGYQRVVHRGRVVSTPRLSRRGLLFGWLVFASGCTAAPPPSVGSPLRSPPKQHGGSLPGPIHTIVVDAGHGGHDPGTSHYGLKEKHVALDIAGRLRTQLQAAGLTVAMTRETDRFIPLSGRPAVANRVNADLFVSVHINANPNGSISGVEVYYPRQSVVSSAAPWPPWVSTAEVSMPSMAVKHVLWDLVLGRTRSHSRRLASAICRSMRDGLQTQCRGVRAARFVVLREAWMPAVLVEVGYVTNQAEARRLGSAAYRQVAAESIARGVLSYIRELGAQHI